ncbi:hypothetical protein LFYK43_03530 [Ligilactobacillus salitolerans]|uniref:Bacteriocin immunity protein n=2 Tax=Ligilactobacillus salitolerans TaxID=1808352 RepID=A0A401IQX3_9LACO|nr:hypothetical protein LFYK43_03530 [Ligilactobacillus salitolerans]
MKSKKEIVKRAEQLIKLLEIESAASDPRLQKVVAYGKDALDKKQIAPQTIMEKVVSAVYSLKLKGIIEVDATMLSTLKEMEKLSRQRSWLPFKAYDPW